MVEMLQLSKSYTSLLRISYGLSVENFIALIESQNGCCPLCLKSLMTTRIVVDHDGSTVARHELKSLSISAKRKLVRGVLHFDCNARLGWLEKFPWLISDHVRKYLDEPPAQFVLEVLPSPPEGRRVRRVKPRNPIRTIDGVKHKWCPDHQDWRPVTEFSESTARPDGYSRRCTTCQRAYYSKRNRERKR